MRATINGEERELPDGTTVAALLAHLRAPQSGIAVACNQRVVRKAEYVSKTIEDGDVVEIIKAVAGG